MKKGFTLIELLTVVLIIGVLTSIALPKYMRAVERARATEAMAAVKAFNDAVYAYAAGRSGSNTCPDTFKKLVVAIPGTGHDTGVLKTRDFCYYLNAASSANIPGTDCNGVVAKRNRADTCGDLSQLDDRFDYVLWNPYLHGNSGQGASLACNGSEGKGKEICESLQIYTESKPTTN